MEQEQARSKLQAELDAEFREWQRIYTEGCGDPRWPDGVYLALCRDRILYGYQRMKERIDGRPQFSMDRDLTLTLPGQRPVPPCAPIDYRAPGQTKQEVTHI